MSDVIKNIIIEWDGAGGPDHAGSRRAAPIHFDSTSGQSRRNAWAHRRGYTS
ncbi:hypothetical protein BN1221_03402c [Brenneria goodwinii]|uniref:Uncharacterized protein n=1 Tax=Brenneria goodwinii TaxID=1109412 RepID=A0A0G4JYH7_9GAMM|nr:hypothetical protein BN1221_03402c [Brenneria goodwinii]